MIENELKKAWADGGAVRRGWLRLRAVVGCERGGGGGPVHAFFGRAGVGFFAARAGDEEGGMSWVGRLAG